MTSQEYNSLKELAISKYGDIGIDILHDLIVDNVPNIKAYLLSQHYLKLKYETW